jgi:hypothetical protein
VPLKYSHGNTEKITRCMNLGQKHLVVLPLVFGWYQARGRSLFFGAGANYINLCHRLRIVFTLLPQCCFFISHQSLCPQTSLRNWQKAFLCGILIIESKHFLSYCIATLLDLEVQRRSWDSTDLGENQ